MFHITLTYLISEVVLGMACMEVAALTHVLATVVKTYVIYMMEPVCHVSLDGQGNSAK